MNHCLQIWIFWFFLQCSFLMLFVPFTLMGHQCVIARKCRVTLSADKSGIVLAGRFGIGRYWNEKGTFLKVESKKLLNTFQKLKITNECIFFPIWTHYSKSQIFFSKNSISWVFHNFSKLSAAKKSKTATFSRIFHPKKFDNFSREIKVVYS